MRRGVFEDCVPNRSDLLGVDEQLESVLSGVAGAGDHRLGSADFAIPETEVRDRLQPRFGGRWPQLLCPRALECEQAQLPAPMLDMCARERGRAPTLEVRSSV